MTVAELLARITSEELTEWMAYEQVTGPLGPERADALNAVLAATVSNTARGRGRKARPADFLIDWDQGIGKPPKTWQDMLAAVKGFNRRLGGTDPTSGGDGDAGSGGPSGRDRYRRRRPDERRRGRGERG